MNTYETLKSDVGYFLGYGHSGFSADEVLEIEKAVNKGVDAFLHPKIVDEVGYKWSFLTPVSTITLTVDEDTYALPSGITGIVGNLHYPKDSGLASIAFDVGQQRIEEAQQFYGNEGYPTLGTLLSTKVDDALVQKLLVYPTPQVEVVITFKGIIDVDETIVDAESPAGMELYSGVISQSCLAAAELYVDDDDGKHEKRFVEMLKGAIDRDRRLKPSLLGYAGDKRPFQSDVFNYNGSSPFYNNFRRE